MTLLREVVGATLVLRVPFAKVKPQACDALEEELKTVSHACGRVVLDFCSIDHLDYGALIFIMRAHRACQARRLTLSVAGLMPGPAAVAELVQLVELVDIYPDVRSALACDAPPIADAVEIEETRGQGAVALRMAAGA